MAETLLNGGRSYRIIQDCRGLETVWHQESFVKAFSRQDLAQALYQAPENIQEKFCVGRSAEPSIELKKSSRRLGPGEFVTSSLCFFEKRALFYDVAVSQVSDFEELIAYLHEYEKNNKNVAQKGIAFLCSGFRRLIGNV